MITISSDTEVGAYLVHLDLNFAAFLGRRYVGAKKSGSRNPLFIEPPPMATNLDLGKE